MERVLREEELDILTPLVLEGIVKENALQPSFEIEYNFVNYKFEIYSTLIANKEHLSFQVSSDEVELTTFVPQAVNVDLFDFTRSKYQVIVDDDQHQMSAHYDLIEDSHSFRSKGNTSYTRCVQLLDKVVKQVELKMYSN